ncbi:neuropilin-2a isoform X3 [Tachysurus fulvidraco]|uniref:neuropilin-2a isoform X3 n=1 Tax=Tachysurus fulvidraco TaxID=1234273 RepID=UPI001FEEB1DB|nr:neuropilin-2a isoform X3 [Tachysurus fulvidraco]
MDITHTLTHTLLLLACCCCCGFTVRAEAEGEKCGEPVDATTAGYITSPGYPSEYPPHQNCEWVITAPEPNQRIILNFNPHFELERLDCRYDFIEIRDGSSDSADLLGRHCSNIAPPAIMSSGPVVHIKFVSDYAHQGAGFSLRYEILKTGSEHCFQNFTAPTGVIESPDFPDKYPHNLECSYIIIAPAQTEVTLTFKTFDLENDPLLMTEAECKYDWLEVWDGLPQVSPLIGRYCGMKIPPEIVSSTGLLSLSFHTDMAVAKDGFSARYNMTRKDVTDSFHCNTVFGMESGKISDEQISASSSFYDGRWLPRMARLNNEDNAWTPAEDSNKEYIQVDLHFLKVLTGIATQGAISKETQKSYYVTTFKLEVSTNGEDWMMYRHGKNHKIFHANTDPSEVVLNRIPQPTLARFVRIRPQTWKNGIALRFELYGCQITDAPCSELQGLLSGQLPDSQITSSSVRDLHWAPSTARLVASRSGWFPAPPQPLAGEEWLQVDLGKAKTVSGLITQGARGGDGGTSSENRAFVRKYRLAYSMNGKDWNFVIDSKTSMPKIFEGNVHFDMPELRRFEELLARFVRIYPERWSPGGIGMRIEVLGCSLPETSTVTVPTSTVTRSSPAETNTAHKLSSPTSSTSPTSPTASMVLCDFEQGFCGWTHDPNSDIIWALHTSSRITAQGQSQDLSLGSNRMGNYLYVEASSKTQGKKARLFSPEVGPETGPLCLKFSYQLEDEGTLRVLLRYPLQEETLLWALHGNQGSMWKEGRTILPRSPKEFQVVIEGIFEKTTTGHIWIDNIHMSSSTPLEECTHPFAAFQPDVPGGALPGRSEPTVDTLSVPPISPNWYYFMAGGGAILFLVIAVVMAIGCRRLTAKRSRPTMAYYSPHSAYYPNGAMSRAGGGPKLTVWVEKGDGNSYW